MKISKYIFWISAFVITTLFFAFGQTDRVYACNPASLKVLNTLIDFTYPSDSPVVINDSPTQDSNIYARASTSGCDEEGLGFAFTISYLATNGHWGILQEAGTSNNWSYLKMSGGELQYRIGVQWNGSLYETDQYFWAMTKTASSSNIGRNSAFLSWALRMPHYGKVSCSSTSLCASSSPSSLFPFYLLIGTDPNILYNRSTDAREIKVEGGWKDYDIGKVRITWYVDNYTVSNLNPDTTYFWRIRGDHPSIPDSYFAGGSFKTLPAAPPPTVTTKDATDKSYTGATLNADVNPNGDWTSIYFRYSTTNPGTCNNTFGNLASSESPTFTGTTSVPYAVPVSGLYPDTTYYFCALAKNSGGYGYGSILSFKTLSSQTLRSDDNSKEADFYIDYQDDWAQKNILVPKTGLFKLWVYGQGYGTYQTGNTSFIKVNNDPNKQITFNPIDKFGANYSWQSFDIPAGWLQEGNNTFYFSEPWDNSHWTWNNLIIGVDTNSSGNSYGCFFDGVNKYCFNNINSTIPITGELMIYLEPVCSGNISLTLNPPSATAGSLVTPTASGLSYCSGKTINFELVTTTGTTAVGSCLSEFSGCTGQAFTAPNSTSTYRALVDKNDNKSTQDPGENKLAILTVTSAPPPGGTALPTTTTSTCGAKDLKLLEGLLTTPGQSVSTTTTDSIKCIIDPRAAFLPDAIPSFDDLKSLYYTQK